MNTRVATFIVHVFYNGRGEEFTDTDFGAAGIDVGALSEDRELIAATEQLLNAPGNLQNFVVDPAYNSRIRTGESNITIRPSEVFG